MKMAREKRIMRRRAGGFFGRAGGRSGMTLVEVILSLGILVVCITTGLAVMMNQVARHRQLSAETAGLHAVNFVMSQIEGFADSSAQDETYAHAILRNIEAMPDGMIDIGPGRTPLRRVEKDAGTGCLIYRFWLPEPGGHQYLESDERFVPNHRAIGELRIYLDERQLNDQYLRQFNWTDLNNASTSADAVMDLNGNRRYTDNLLADYKDVEQLGMSIFVDFFADEAHSRRVFSATRNLIEARVKNKLEDFSDLDGI